MTRSTGRPRGAALALALLTLAPLALTSGCVSEDELHRAVSDDVRLTGRVMGFALDADVEALETRLALLQAFQGDPKEELLQRHLGTVAEVEAKLERVRETRRALIEEHQRLQSRYAPQEE